MLFKELQMCKVLQQILLYSAGVYSADLGSVFYFYYTVEQKPASSESALLVLMHATQNLFPVHREYKL